jgi:hypothetical protein
MVKIDLKRHKVIMTMALYEASRIGEMLKTYADREGIRDPSLRAIVDTLLGAGDQVIQIP